MCAVYAPTRNHAWVCDTFRQNLPEVGHDVYPGQMGPIVVKSHRDERIAIGLARFGLLPPWAKDSRLGRHTYNARSESVTDKPSYRGAWHARQFAIVLADRFYEPCYETGKACRWAIESADGTPMAIAGLWDRWVKRDSGEIVVSFTMLTVNADGHPIMGRFHRPSDEKRTPLVLSLARLHDWLGATPDVAKQLLSVQSMPALVSFASPVSPANRLDPVKE